MNFIYLYEDRTMTPVEIVLRSGGLRMRESDRREVNLHCKQYMEMSQ
jgi:hypothetical protein